MKADLEAQVLAAKMPEWRKWWAELPAGFRETIFRNAGVTKSLSGEPLRSLSLDDLNHLIVAAGRYADLCRKAEAWLLKEREARR
jgi:hypothetical protein